MTPNSTCLKQSYQSILSKIKGIHFTRHATQSGFKKRRERKLTGKLLLTSFFVMALRGHNSFQLWAEIASLLGGHGVSKQAIWKRITSQYTKFLMGILSQAMRTQLSERKAELKNSLLRKRYKRILIQDSTCIALPSCLHWWFPGNVSRGEPKAVLKIQVIFDLISNQFIYFEVTPFTFNDQSQSKNILLIAKKGDLIIRDLGYFSLDCLNQMACAGIGFVSRLRFGVKISDSNGKKQINLEKVLHANGTFDQLVCIGSNTGAQVRLIAFPLSQEQASRRVFKAKHDRDKRLNHSKEYYRWLKYSIYITKESQDKVSAQQVARLYGLRWRIETIFKCWKSHFHFQALIPTNISMTQHRAEAIIYMMLIFCLLFQLTTYRYLLSLGHRCISLNKLCRYLASNFIWVLQKNEKSFIPEIIRYCSYEKRKSRANFIQKLELG